MKHCLLGLLFLLIFSRPVLASIDLTISDISKKDDHFQLTAKVTGMSSSSATYIQGMFTPKDATKYFGFTFSKTGQWLKYDGSPEKQFVLDNFIKLDNETPATIFLKPDYDDPDYQGPGKYLLKLKRYTASGSPSDYSNTLEVDLNFATLTPQPTTTSTPTPTSTAHNLQPTITPTSTPTIPPKTPTPTPTSKTTNTNISPSATSTIYDQKTTIIVSPQVLATSTSDISLGTISAVSVENISSTNYLATTSSESVSDRTLFLIGAIIFSVSGSLLYFRLKTL